MINEVKWTRPQGNSDQSTRAHADVDKNHSFTKDFIEKHPGILEKTQVVFDGINKDYEGKFEYNTHATFSWKRKRTNFAWVANFNQPHSEYKNQLHKFFKMDQNQNSRITRNISYLD